MNDRFDRLLAVRGDMVKGAPASAWEANLSDLDRDEVLRAVIHTIRTLLLPEWESRRPDDRRPHLALEATEAWIASKSPDAIASTKARAKACTEARTETMGYIHRVPEAARAVAWCAGAKDSKHLWEALTATEEELLYRISLVAEYHKQPEQRRAIVSALRAALDPAARPAEPQAPSDEAVPYSAKGSFVVGQKIAHVKFGTVVVAAAGDKWIDVDLEDGSRKRLAQKL